jgi:hypothetical protein
MIEDKKLGIKIAENPRDKLIEEALEAAKSRILHTELSLELEKNAKTYLENLKSK